MRTRGLDTVGIPVGKLHRIQNRPERLWPNVVDINPNAGVTVAASATPHTAGAWTEVIAATSGPVDWIAVWVLGTAAAGTDTSALLDIGIGAVAAETVVVSSLPAGWKAAETTSLPLAGMAMFPLDVPKGTRISVRLQALIVSDTAEVFTETYFQGLRCGKVVDTYGAVTASSRGTNMPTSNTYVELTAGTSQPYQALVVLAAAGGSTVSALASSTYTLGAGPAAAETVLLVCNSSSSISETIKTKPREVAIYSGHVPAGTRLAGKQAVGANYRDIIVLGIRY